MNFKTFLNVTRFTIQDELHNKSFYVFTVISVLFVLLLKGCFNSNVVVNGQTVNSVTVGYNASIIAFNIIACMGCLMGILLAMRVIKKDKDDGMAVAVLAKPVKRIEYTLGKVIGIWVLAYGLTLILHLTVYIIMLVNTGGRIPFFIPASLITSLNVLMGVVMVMLFSMFMPDVISAFAALAVGIVSFALDSIYAVSQTAAFQAMMGQNAGATSLWKIIWPKIAALQYFATAIIKEAPFQVLGPVHPAINIALYCVILFALFFWRFSKEDIQ